MQQHNLGTCIMLNTGHDLTHTDSNTTRCGMQHCHLPGCYAPQISISQSALSTPQKPTGLCFWKSVPQAGWAQMAKGLQIFTAQPSPWTYFVASVQPWLCISDKQNMVCIIHSQISDMTQQQQKLTYRQNNISMVKSRTRHAVSPSYWAPATLQPEAFHQA